MDRVKCCGVYVCVVCILLVVADTENEKREGKIKNGNIRNNEISKTEIFVSNNQN